jgi:sugar/nucleoside kinase (ribokinase family)
MKSNSAEALIIGCPALDINLVIGNLPGKDEKIETRDYSFSIGGNGPTAGFTLAKLLGGGVDMMIPIASDTMSQIYWTMANQAGINVIPRRVKKFPVSAILAMGEDRRIITGRNMTFGEFPRIEVGGYRVLHGDRHQPDALRHHALMCRAKEILTSLDVGKLEKTSDELIGYMDVVVVSEGFCNDMRLTPGGVLEYLKGRGCKVGGVTFSERGLLWYEGDGEHKFMPALTVATLDSSGAGDVFRGGYLFSYLRNPEASWQEHFDYGRAASAHKVQIIGNIDGIPSLEQLEYVKCTYPESSLRPADI